MQVMEFIIIESSQPQLPKDFNLFLYEFHRLIYVSNRILVYKYNNFEEIKYFPVCLVKICPSCDAL